MNCAGETTENGHSRQSGQGNLKGLRLAAQGWWPLTLVFTSSGGVWRWGRTVWVVCLVPINVSEPQVSFGSSQHGHILLLVCSLWVSPPRPPGDPWAAWIISSSPSSASCAVMFPDFSKHFQHHCLVPSVWTDTSLGFVFSYVLRKLHGSPGEVTESLKIKSKIFEEENKIFKSKKWSPWRLSVLSANSLCGFVTTESAF